MRGKVFLILLVFVSMFVSCKNENIEYYQINPEITLEYPKYFPSFNYAFKNNKPTKYGVELGKKLFNDKRLSINNTISCATCHVASKSFSDGNKVAIGVFGKKSFRNVPPLQNLMFKKHYMWDGNHLSLEDQVLVPIITPEEMGSNILDVIQKIKNETTYLDLFLKTFGDKKITGDRIYKSIAQYEYTLISINSKFDKFKNNQYVFSNKEAKGYDVFKQKCVSCHPAPLFTDGSFRNIGFPLNQNLEETGRERVTRDVKDFMAFKVPSLRNIEYTAPYGSFGQFPTLKSVLDYFDNGVIISDNLDPLLKDNNGKISLTEKEKEYLIAFLKSLSDSDFVKKR